MSVIYTITPGTTLINNQYHSFWNQELDAIATTSLEQTAQDALASGVAANAKADTLLATALQVSGQNYTGLPEAGIALQDSGSKTAIILTPEDGVISTNTTVLAKGAGTGVNCFENLDKTFSVQANGNCTVNQLTYTSLNPPIGPGATPTLAEVLAAGNDGGTYAIVNISQVTAKDSLQILKDTDQPELGTYSFSSSPTGFSVDEAASLTANTLIGGSPDGIAFQNADASFRANFDGSVNTTSVSFPNSTSIVAGGNGEISFDGANVVDVNNLTLENNLTVKGDGIYGDPLFVTQTNALLRVPVSLQTTDFPYSNKISLDNNSGNITCNQLNYQTLNPVPPSTWVPTATSNLAMSNYSITGNNNLATASITLPATGTTTTSLNEYGLNTEYSVQVTNTGGSGEIRANNVGIYSDNSVTRTAIVSQVGDAYFNQYYIYGVGPSDFSITHNGNITTSGNVACALVNGVAPQFKPTYNYFVSKGGNDTTGLGSILSPYLTIQKAISVCEAFADNVPRVVNVAAGSYAENLTLTKSRISIVGQGQSSRPDVGTSISGTVTITLASGNSDLNNNNIYFSNFLINGQFEDNTASTSYPHRVFFDRCQLYADNRVLYLHPAGDYRAFVSNCVISNSNTSATDPVVECYSSSTGMVSFTTNQITSKGASQNVFKLSGSCRIDTYAQNILTSDSVGTNVAHAIFVHNSTATISLGQNAFVYSSAGAKRNADTAAGIFMNAASAGGSLVLASNFFSLTGLPSGENAVQNNSAAGVVIYGGNISTSSVAGTSAFAISGTNNVTKFAMTSVQ